MNQGCRYLIVAVASRMEWASLPFGSPQDSTGTATKPVCASSANGMVATWRMPDRLIPALSRKLVLTHPGRFKAFVTIPDLANIRVMMIMTTLAPAAIRMPCSPTCLTAMPIRAQIMTRL